ncbi:transposase, partial [Streptomyces sp. H27-G5]|uniref:IS66 family transposase n=1 Tax=Streptomyces sp. H27-G5 TaxID=2996698 RepID=UPI00226E2EC9
MLVGPLACDGCGGDLQHLDLEALAAAGARVASKAQVLDVPPVKLRCTEYRMLKIACPNCSSVSAGTAPSGVFGPVCYGPDVKAATVLLAVRGHMSVVRAAQMMHALLDAQVSTGFASGLIRRLATELTPFMTALKARLKSAPVLHLDETPASVSGDEMRQFETEALLRGEHLAPDRRQPGPDWMYVHVARAGPLIWLGAHKRRSHEATDSFNILTGYEGVLVTDRLALYDKYAKTAAGRQICCAHILRDLTGVIEGEPGVDHSWALAAQDTLRDFHRSVEQAKATGANRLDAPREAELHRRWRHAYLVGLAQNAGRRTSQNKRHPAWVAAEMLKNRT